MKTLLDPPALARIAAITALLASTGCEQPSATTGTGGSGGTPSEGGAGGSGGAGGAATSSAVTTSSTTTTTAPLTCAESVTIPAITGECDILQQNCPPGETCVPTMTGQSTICRIGGGLKGPGKPCEVEEECQAGLFCVGFCTQACCPADDQPCGGGVCNIELGFAGGLTVFTCSYSEQCTLFETDTCKNGQKCQFVFADQGLAVCTIKATSPAGEGEHCDYINECGSMQICFAETCRYNCKLGSNAEPGKGGCPAGQTCQDALPPGAGDVGVCQ